MTGATKRLPHPCGTPAKRLTYLRNIWMGVKRLASTEEDPDLSQLLEVASECIASTAKFAAVVWKEPEPGK